MKHNLYHYHDQVDEVGLSGRRGLILGLVYLVVALILTWPTVAQLTTHLPGDGGDDPAIAWNLWWVKYALLNQGQNPFQTDFIFYPIGINLAFYTLTVLNAITALPLTLNLGLVTASNLHMFFTFAVGGYGAYLLVRQVLVTVNDEGRTGVVRGSVERYDEVSTPGRRSFFAAAIAGGFYAFASSKLFYVALGQFNIASHHWIPFAVLYILRTKAHPDNLKNPLLAGLFLTMQAWTEMTYASFLLVFIGLFWLYWILADGLQLWQRGNKDEPDQAVSKLRIWRPIISQLQAAFVLGLTFAAGISPILAQMLPDMLAEGDFLVEGGGFADVFRADLFGFIIPTMPHPLLGDLITRTGISDFDKGQHIYLGFILLSLLLVGLYTGYRSPHIRFWLIAAFAFALLALGPLITVNGSVTNIPGPFIILQNLPFFKGNRYPSRYSVMLMLSLSVIAGFAITRIGQWFSRKSAGTTEAAAPRLSKSQPPASQLSLKPYAWLIGIASLFLFEHLALPLPQSDMRVPEFYQSIAAESGDFTVLDIPFAWRNGFRITGALTTQFMFGQFYQTAHQKRLLQGNTSRNPAFKFQYFTNAPVLNSLLALETGKPLPPERWAADRAIAAEVLDFFNIEYVVVRPYHYDRFDGTNTVTVTEQAIIPYLEEIFPVEKIHAENSTQVYRVRQTGEREASLLAGREAVLQSEYLIDPAGPLAPLYFGEGWGLLKAGRPMAAQRRQVRLLLPLTDAPQQVILRMRLPEFYRAPEQSVSLELNGWRSPWQQVERTWQEYSFEIPAGVARMGLNDLHLHFDRISELPSFQPGNPPVDVTVLSAGDDVGKFGHIYLNGYNLSPNRRGYNVAIIEPVAEGGSRLKVGSFDTHFEGETSDALVRFIGTPPPGSVIALAAADEASLNLTERAVLALEDIGATGDLRGCFRCSHALISQITPADHILTDEALDPLGPAGVTTGLGLTEPQIAALIEWIRVAAVEP